MIRKLERVIGPDKPRSALKKNLKHNVNGICPVFSSHQDENTSALMMVVSSTLWLGVRMSLLCSLMVAAAGYGAILVTQSPGMFAVE